MAGGGASSAVSTGCSGAAGSGLTAIPGAGIMVIGAEASASGAGGVMIVPGRGAVDWPVITGAGGAFRATQPAIAAAASDSVSARVKPIRRGKIMALVYSRAPASHNRPGRVIRGAF